MSATPVRRLFQALNAQNASRAAEQLTPSYHGIDTTRSTFTVGRAEAQAEIEAGLVAFASPTFTIHQQTAEDTQVSVFWSVEAVHEGPFLQIPPTHRALSVSGTSLFTIRDGRIARGVHLWDLAGLLRVLGLLPDLPDTTAGPPPDPAASAA